MANDVEPIVGNWYVHLDKGQKFKVVAVDEECKLVEIQHFDGDIEEASLAEWDEMQLELSEEPQNWSGPIDFEEVDDLGTEITDTSKEEWFEPLGEFREADREKPIQESGDIPDEWGEGLPVEEPLGEEEEKRL
jgi:hypothetical protein